VRLQRAAVPKPRARGFEALQKDRIYSRPFSEAGSLARTGRSNGKPLPATSARRVRRPQSSLEPRFFSRRFVVPGFATSGAA